MAKRARVVYDVASDGRRWKITAEGGAVRSLHSTKDQAVNTALKVAKQNAPSQLRIHKLDGSIESERRYEEDRFPPHPGARQSREE
ncbi:MAG TPA: DUF2188 domain-containing protein [Candidatus Polarisedimenticolaceae bacterium]|nr:DUF2188 domain-containing protein [Candidatus Polarisedimenticolaceae bacterium]